MGQKKVVLDTNILISALGWGGKPKKIFQQILDHHFQLVISNQQIIELEKVMNYPKFKFTTDQKARFLSIILEIALVVKIDGIVNIIKDDPDDNVILESAIIGDADFIISGDFHLLDLKEYAKVKIVTPAEFLK